MSDRDFSSLPPLGEKMGEDEVVSGAFLLQR